MGNRKEYRSAVRSRLLIRQAFQELLAEKPIEKITVTDIVKRADINRSTFYAHYPDVRGLVEEIMGEVVDHSVQIISEVDIFAIFDDPMPLLKAVSDISTENLELYRLLGRTDFALHQTERVKNVLMEKAVNAANIPEHIRTSTAFRIQIHFFIGGILNTYQQWLQGSLECSTDEIMEQIAALIANNADTYRNWQ